MIKLSKILLPITLSISFVLSGCSSTEESSRIEVAKTKSYVRNYQGIKSKIAIGKFENRTNYQNGLFSDGVDRLGMRAKSILMSHLQQTGRFIVLDRTNLEEIKFESNISAKSQSLIGAKYIVTGSISEFGRKEAGTHALLFFASKSQIAYTKVIINVIDVNTSAVVYTALGAGEFKLTDKQNILFGSNSSYDSTLTDKVINLAIDEAVTNLVNGIESQEWNPER